MHKLPIFIDAKETTKLQTNVIFVSATKIGENTATFKLLCLQ